MNTIRLIITFSFLVHTLHSFSQQTIPSQEEKEVFLTNLYKHGVDKSNGMIELSEDSKRAMTDEKYRALLYPQKYTWDKVIALADNFRIKQAFWHLINLYSSDEKSKELVVRVILGYKSFIDVEEALTSSFYSYSFMDKQVGQLKADGYSVDRPDILEDKLNALKEILAYVRES